MNDFTFLSSKLSEWDSLWSQTYKSGTIPTADVSPTSAHETYYRGRCQIYDESFQTLATRFEAKLSRRNKKVSELEEALVESCQRLSSAEFALAMEREVNSHRTNGA
eukprot:PhF_6_TR32378/c0_g1_i2/m.48021